MPPKIDAASRLYLLEILQLLRLQQEKVHDLSTKVDALVESILRDNPPYLAAYLEMIESLNTPEQRQAFAHALLHIDELIQSLREPLTVH